ncbi:hypothetical protein [Streptomyces mirabilis]|uniref:hypothetical protein n=1 Tax=Streptomyces mirabilis TaxID=68239 RepID=UPI0036DB30A9
MHEEDRKPVRNQNGKHLMDLQVNKPPTDQAQDSPGHRTKKRWLRGACAVTAGSVILSGSLALASAPSANAMSVSGGLAGAGGWLIETVSEDAFSGLTMTSVLNPIFAHFGLIQSAKTIGEIQDKIKQIQDQLTAMDETVSNIESTAKSLDTLAYNQQLGANYVKLRNYARNVHSVKKSFDNFMTHVTESDVANKKATAAKATGNTEEYNKQIAAQKTADAAGIGDDFVSEFIKNFGPNSSGDNATLAVENELKDTIGGISDLPGKKGNWTYNFMKGVIQGDNLKAADQNTRLDFLKEVYTARSMANDMFATALRWRMAHLPAPDRFNPSPDDAAAYLNNDSQSLKNVIDILKKNTPPCRMPAEKADTGPSPLVLAGPVGEFGLKNTVLDPVTGRLFVTDPRTILWPITVSHFEIANLDHYVLSDATSDSIPGVAECPLDKKGLEFSYWDNVTHSPEWVADAGIFKDYINSPEYGYSDYTPAGNEVLDSYPDDFNPAQGGYYLETTALPGDPYCQKNPTNNACAYKPEYFNNS